MVLSVVYICKLISYNVTVFIVTIATFSSFENVSQLTVKECILSFAPKSCDLDPIPYKLLIEYNFGRDLHL